MAIYPSWSFNCELRSRCGDRRNIASVDAAADLGRTVTFCAKHNLGGMEGLIGVPGTVAARCE